jgi:hypothetical protein
MKKLFEHPQIIKKYHAFTELVPSILFAYQTEYVKTVRQTQNEELEHFLEGDGRELNRTAHSPVTVVVV